MWCTKLSAITTAVIVVSSAPECSPDWTVTPLSHSTTYHSIVVALPVASSRPNNRAVVLVNLPRKKSRSGRLLTAFRRPKNRTDLARSTAVTVAVVVWTPEPTVAVPRWTLLIAAISGVLPGFVYDDRVITLEYDLILVRSQFEFTGVGRIEGAFGYPGHHGQRHPPQPPVLVE